MKWLAGIFLVVALALSRVTAFATDQDSFNKLIAKYAPRLGPGFKPKSACACTESFPARAGFVISTDVGQATPQLYCAVPLLFGGDGTLFSSATCQHFEVLGK